MYLTSPNFIGATVLQLAKLKNFEFHYRVMKNSCSTFPRDWIQPFESDREAIEKSRELIQSIDLVYCDTDSLAYKITTTEKGKGLTHARLYAETIFNNYMDKSNFKTLSQKGKYVAGEMGKLKSEIGDNIVKEIICLSPKVYSIQCVEKTTGNCFMKQAVKGCPIPQTKKVYTHNVFQKMLNDPDYEAPSAHSNHIRRDLKNWRKHNYTIQELFVFI